MKQWSIRGISEGVRSDDIDLSILMVENASLQTCLPRRLLIGVLYAAQWNACRDVVIMHVHLSQAAKLRSFAKRTAAYLDLVLTMRDCCSKELR